MSYSNILLSAEDGIAVLTVNRPDKMNALNRATLAEIKDAVQKIKEDPSVKGLIITGSGEKAFVAGADIAEFAAYTPEEGEAMSIAGQEVFSIIENCPKPVAAAVNGFALGGGCELAMACHIRIASQHAKFGQPEVSLGIIPGYGGTQRMPRLVGMGKALEWMLTGEMISAEEAYRTGLVNYVTPPQELMPKCRELLAKIFSKGPLAVAKVIRCVNDSYKKVLDGYASEAESFGECFATEDFKTGTSAFLARKKAEFKGK